MISSLFENVPKTAEIMISVDNGAYQHICDNKINVELSKGCHFLSILCKEKRDVKRKVKALTKENPHLICVNTSILSFEQTFDIWVKKAGFIKFEYSVGKEKDALECLCEKPNFRMKSANVQLNKESYTPILKNKLGYLISQIFNIILILFPLIALTAYIFTSEIPLLGLSEEEWLNEYYFVGRLKPLPSLIFEGGAMIILFLFFFIKYIIALCSQYKKIK